MLEDHRFPVDDAITHIVPMDEAPGILAAWNRDPAPFGKIVIELS